MTDADKVMNAQHFGVDLADSYIRIQINLQLRMAGILEHFWLRLDVMVEVWILWSLSSFSFAYAVHRATITMHIVTDIVGWSVSWWCNDGVTDVGMLSGFDTQLLWAEKRDGSWRLLMVVSSGGFMTKTRPVISLSSCHTSASRTPRSAVMSLRMLYKSAVLSSRKICVFYYAPAPGERGIKRWFCPSVRPSHTYVANNWRTQIPGVPKFGRKVPHLWYDSHTSFEVKRSKVKVTRPINADTHRLPYLPNGKTYELQTSDDPRRPQVPVPPRSKVKVARSRDQSEPSWPNAVPVSLEAGGAYRVGRTRQPHF